MSRNVVRISLSMEKAQRLISKYPHSSVVVLSPDLLEQEGIVGPEKDRLDKMYLDFVAGLAAKDGSTFWWANSLSEKNELISPLFAHLSVLYAFDRWLKRHPSQDCIVVCDAGLCEAVRSLVNEHYDVEGGGPGLNKFAGIMRNSCRYVVKLMLAFWKEIYRMVLSRGYPGAAQKLRSVRKARVIKSWVDHRSYRSGDYQDAYFPKVLPYLHQHNVPYILLADIIQDFRGHFKSIVADRKNLIIPIDYFLTFGNLCRAVVLQWASRPSVESRLKFASIDVTSVVRNELAEGLFSTRFFTNILYYFKIKRLAQTVDIHSFVYTFENYAWEKMCLKAFKDSAPSVRTVGFQHAFIAKNSFKYFLGEQEVGIVPCPDSILTMGEVTKRILNTYGHWPGKILSTGCALRQFGTMNGAQGGSVKSRDILVAFTMTREESIKILEFIFEAGLARHPHDVHLRFHPQTPVTEVLKGISFELPANFKISRAPSLNDDFKRAGVVLYTWTTVGLEALVNGIPVIYLDVNKPLNLDPLFECSVLKEQAARPQELKEKIEKFLNLPEDIYAGDLAKARQYLKDYFSPVNEEALALFAR